MQGFGALESAVMRLLWSRGTPATVREILTELRSSRELAYTTVLTVMDNLYKKGWLTRQQDGRAHRYAPVVTREEYVAGAMREVLDSSGDRAQALLHFVGRMTLEDAAALRTALNTFERKIAGR